MIKEFLSACNLLTTVDIDNFLSLTQTRNLKKGDFFICEGQLCKEVAFIHSGIFRSFLTSPSGEEITYCILFPNNLVTAYSSYITASPSLENIQAITPCELIVIRKCDIEQLSASSLNWTKFLKMMAEQQYLELEKRLFMFQKEKAKKRYTELITNQPEYIRQIPLRYLASYLGITVRHLSRLRKDFLYA